MACGKQLWCQTSQIIRQAKGNFYKKGFKKLNLFQCKLSNFNGKTQTWIEVNYEQNFDSLIKYFYLLILWKLLKYGFVYIQNSFP